MERDSSWFDQYSSSFFDEVFTETKECRPHYDTVLRALARIDHDELKRRNALTDLSFQNQGITFSVYGSSQTRERPFPLDLLPRIISANEWKTLEKGLIQRVKALNLFLKDIYGAGHILSSGIIPPKLILDHPQYLKQLKGVELPFGAYTHISGIDLVRNHLGEYQVLEDNLRTPSGVSYVLSNRRALTRNFTQVISKSKVRLVDDYPAMLLANLKSLSPRTNENPVVVVLTPGSYNSAYFEHVFLAQQMGVELVEGSDLFVDEGLVWMRTTSGKKRVDVIYRRVDDDYLDPLAFNQSSTVGVPGLFNVYRNGKVAIANALGTGVADDKAIYAYVPRIIEYYLGEKPILNNVETFIGAEKDGADYIISNAANLVIKRVDQSGGYGMLIGPHSNSSDIEDFLVNVREKPAGFVGQPVVGLSTHPTYIDETCAFEPRHIDLRPFVLAGERIQVLPGGLTRVALKRGSLVVNSSQGGGSKDTWVLS